MIPREHAAPIRVEMRPRTGGSNSAATARDFRAAPSAVDRQDL